MNREALIMVCTSDIAGQVRGKGFPAQDLKSRMTSGIGWTPTNLMITAFGPIAPSPWGALDDLILLPDPTTEAHVDFGDGSPPEHFFLGDILTLDGQPWDCCGRSFLKAALAELEGHGLGLFAAFEHELYYDGALERIGSGYNLDSIRRQGAFAESFLHALIAARLEPDSFLPEYGPRQYEVTCRPAIGVTAADRAVILRELARATAIRLGQRVSFAPMVRPDGGVGNGLHIHMSLRDLNGRPVTYDPDSPSGLSEPAGRFVAGILRHMPALCAFTAPSVVSYARLVPHKWSAAYNNLGTRDREAGVRICPLNPRAGTDAAEQFNFEYRAADSTASPYVALGVLVRAGLEGLKAKLPAPPDTPNVPGDLDDAAWAKRGIVRLPQSLGTALDALEADTAARAWLPPAFLDAYLRYKRFEIGLMEGLSLDELCARYSEAY
ncbi:MAG: glutamine synthetase family protein [Kiloniellales bacterium]